MKYAVNALRFINRKTFIPALLHNRIALMKAYSRKLPISRGFPNIVQIELTNICNLQCPMCPQSLITRPKGFMSVNLFGKIADELSRSSVEIVILQVYGESFLHPDFLQLLSMIKSADLTVLLSTNAVSLNETVAKGVVDMGLDILVISYDSDDPTIYSQIRKGASLSKVRDNIQYFLSYKGTKLPYTVFQIIDFPKFSSQKKGVMRKWGRFDVKIAKRPSHDWLGDNEGISQFSNPRVSSGLGICDQPWRHLVILWDGTVIPCCNFYDGQVKLGNVIEGSITEIWNNNLYRAFRSKHTKFSRECISECKTCKQKAPNTREKFGLVLLDQVTINKILHSVDGWRWE